MTNHNSVAEVSFLESEKMHAQRDEFAREACVNIENPEVYVVVREALDKEFNNKMLRMKRAMEPSAPIK